jgi:hypothetical protein
VLRPFRKLKGVMAGAVRRSVGLRKKKVGWARAAVRGGVGQAGRLRPSGEGESGPVGEEGRWPRPG